MRWLMILLLTVAVAAVVLPGCQGQQIQTSEQEQAKVVPCPKCGEPTPIGQQCSRCGFYVTGYEEIEKGL